MWRWILYPTGGREWLLNMLFTYMYNLSFWFFWKISYSSNSFTLNRYSLFVIITVITLTSLEISYNLKRVLLIIVHLSHGSWITKNWFDCVVRSCTQMTSWRGAKAATYAITKSFKQTYFLFLLFYAATAS